VTFASALGGFLRAPGRRRILAIEAVSELVRARLMTLLPARIYARDFGRMSESPITSDPPARDVTADPAQIQLAVEIGRVVETVARAMPFRAVCLQQSLASRRMLRRRGVPAVVCLAVNRDAAERAAPERGTAAHAWIEVGSHAIGGGENLGDYAVVARFT